MPDKTRTIVVIGAGAAGLMAALHAAGPGREVIILERTADGGRKILISGGGRCNVLPSSLDHRRYVTASSPNSLRKILRAWSLADQRTFFETEASLPLVMESATGKLFPVANRSRAVRDALVHLARHRGAIFRTGVEVTSLAPGGGQWHLALKGGSEMAADAVIVSTGGLSVPQTGSDGFGLRQLAALGHTIHPTYPALTPLTLDPPDFADLAGISLTVSITAHSESETAAARGGFLFTHRGYSGPALLDVSHVAVRGRLAGESKASLTVSWHDDDEAAWLERLTPSARAVGTAVREYIPARLADRVLTVAGVDPSLALAQLSRTQRQSLVSALTAFELPWTSDEGYKKAEVTGGGVALGEVHPGTLESRRHPGLFIAGEVLDAFGPIGGYNFVWAWVTGRLAGLGAARSRES